MYAKIRAMLIPEIVELIVEEYKSALFIFDQFSDEMKASAVL